jgi:hypothetical protein
MSERILTLSADSSPIAHNKPVLTTANPARLAACIALGNGRGNLGFALAMVTPFVDEVVVLLDTDDRAAMVAREYGAKVVLLADCNGHDARAVAESRAGADWVFWIDSRDRLAETDVEQIRAQLPRTSQTSEIFVELSNSQVVGIGAGAPAKLRVHRVRSSPTIPQ